jgi:hypothetical protein
MFSLANYVITRKEHFKPLYAKAARKETLGTGTGSDRHVSKNFIKIFNDLLKRVSKFVFQFVHRWKPCCGMKDRFAENFKWT